MFGKAFTAAVAGLALASGAFAQGSWPAQPIKIIVGYPAGGASDVAARLVAQKMAERMGKAIVVENRPGAAGNIGAEAVARAQPDGYTLLLGTISLSVNPSLYPSPTYAPIKASAPISMIPSTPFLLVANPATPYKPARELLEAAKNPSAPINSATAGNGSGSPLFPEMLANTAGIKLSHVPYRG